eukprot:920598-Prymnesium_polylepis.1
MSNHIPSTAASAAIPEDECPAPRDASRATIPITCTSSCRIKHQSASPHPQQSPLHPRQSLLFPSRP